MRYNYLLVDLDDTLLDYRLSERLSLIGTLADMGIQATEDACRLYSAINVELWQLREKGMIDRQQLRQQRFARLLSALGLPGTLADQANELYTRHLRSHGDTLPGAAELLRALHGRVKIAAVTNGVTDVQRTRLAHSGLLPLLDEIVISEEVGLRKPDPAIIHYALKQLNCTHPEQAVMLGDSLSADIAAANAAGIDSIWLTQTPGEHHEAVWCVSALDQVYPILMGE